MHLHANVGPHRQEPGIYGCSVQYDLTQSVDQLAHAGQFPHPMISFVRERELMAAAQRAGYTLYLVKTRGTGYHYTLIVYRANEREALHSLPDDLATALSVTFQRKRIPFPVTPRWETRSCSRSLLTSTRSPWARTARSRSTWRRTE